MGAGSASPRGVESVSSRGHGFSCALWFLCGVCRLLLAAQENAAVPAFHHQSGGADRRCAGRRIIAARAGAAADDRCYRGGAGIGGRGVAPARGTAARDGPSGRNPQDQGEPVKKICLLLIVLAAINVAVAQSLPPVSTFSIVAIDPQNGDLGVAVASRY